MVLTSMPLDDIVIKHRFRQDLGSLDDLVASIQELGLLQPIAIYADGTLVAGQRRLMAWRQAYPYEPIPVRELPAGSRLEALKAEMAENSCRLPMTPSELMGLGEAIMEEERGKAEARRLAGNARGGKSPGRGADGGLHSDEQVEDAVIPDSKQKTTEAVATVLGIGKTTFEGLRLVHKTAESDPDPAVRETARREVEEMDRTGKVAGSVRRVRAAKKSNALKHASPLTKPATQPARRRSASDKPEVLIPRGVNIVAPVCEMFTKIGADSLATVEHRSRKDWSGQIEALGRSLVEFADLLGGDESASPA
jgi:ParB family transcriptional regulator, chromosome partitioning protein